MEIHFVGKIMDGHVQISCENMGKVSVDGLALMIMTCMEQTCLNDCEIILVVCSKKNRSKMFDFFFVVCQIIWLNSCHIYIYTYCLTIYLVGGLEHDFYLSIQLGM